MELKRSLIITSFSVETLLIVPYGIETWPFGIVHLFLPLLIVPYGIETWNR